MMWNRCERFPANEIVSEVVTRNNGGRRLCEGGGAAHDTAVIEAKWLSDVGRVGVFLFSNAKLKALWKVW